MFTDDQLARLRGPLDESRVKIHPFTKMDYLATWDCIAMANEIFGYDGWGYETTRLEEVKPNLGWMATVKVTVGALAREDSGFAPYAIGERGLLGETVDTAVKAAVSDALKRALRSFGEQFGNTLYNKARKQSPQSQGQTQPARAPQQAQQPPAQQAQRPGNDEKDACPSCGNQKKAAFEVCYNCKQAGRTAPPPQEQQEAPDFASYFVEVKTFMTLQQFNDEVAYLQSIASHPDQRKALNTAAQNRGFHFDAGAAAFVDPHVGEN